MVTHAPARIIVATAPMVRADLQPPSSVVSSPPSLPSFNAFSPANQLEKLENLREMYRKDNETLLSRYSWLKPTSGGNV